MTATADKVRALLRDPYFRIRMYRSGWEETGKPVYVWKAVAVCTEHRMFLDWVADYLAGVAQRMEEAKAAPDLRKVLPAILGFPAKPGPSRPLDPGGGEHEDALLLAILFGIEIERGQEPNAALRKAAAHRDLPAEVTGYDERTLFRWVTQVVGLERKPRTNAEWRTALRSHFGAFTDLTEQAFADLIEQESRETQV